MVVYIVLPKIGTTVEVLDLVKELYFIVRKGVLNIVNLDISG